MDSTKQWWKSKTVWGGLITLGAAVAGAFGVSVDAETQGMIVEYVSITASAIGGLVAILGRIKADKRIGK